MGPWMAAAPAAISAVGSLIGGLGSLFGKSGGSDAGATADLMQHSTNLSKHQAYWQAMDLPSYMVEGAKKAGIHPLVAMGMKPEMVAPSVVPMYKGERDWEGAGQAFQRAGAHLDTIVNKQNAALDLEYKELRNKNLEIENQAKEKAINDMTSGPAYNAGLAANDFEASTGIVNMKSTPANEIVPDRTTASRSPGKAAGVGPLEKDALEKDPYGDKVYLWDVLDPQLSDTLESDAFNGVKRFVQKFWGYIKGIAKNPQKPTLNPPPGTKWYWNKWRGQWYLTKPGTIKKGRHQYQRGSRNKIYRGTIHR